MAVLEDNHSVYTEYNDEDELVHTLIDKEMAMMSPPWNFSLPSGDSFGNFDSWKYAEHSEVQQLQNGTEMMQQSSGTHPQRNDDHFVNVHGLFHMPIQWPVDTARGMMESSPLPSDDSLGSIDPDSLWGDSVVQKLQNWQTFQPCSKCFTLRSPSLSGLLRPCKPGLPGVTAFLLHLEWLCQNMVVELGNGEEIMRLTVKKAYLEVDFSSEENYAFCISQAPEPECWGEMMERNSVSRRYAFCSRTHCSNVILELLGVAVRVLLYLGIKNYTFGISINNDRYVNTKMHKLVCLGRTFLNFLEMPHLHILQRLFLYHLERFALEGVAKLLNRKEIKVRYLEVGTALKKNHSVGILPALDQAECRGRVMQQNPSYESRIPESSATNEERNVVGLKRIDAIANSSREKDTIYRRQKDDGITRESLEQLFDKSRDDAAKALKVSTSTLKRACRKFGIAKWPIHKRKRANCPLNQKQAAKKHKGSQQCPALPPDEATTTLQANSAMSVKVTYKKDTVRFPLSSSSTMKYLEEQLERRFKIPLDNFSIKYQDEEDEWISVICDSDLMYCMDVLRSSGKTVIRMMVTPKSD